MRKWNVRLSVAALSAIMAAAAPMSALAGTGGGWTAAEASVDSAVSEAADEPEEGEPSETEEPEKDDEPTEGKEPSEGEDPAEGQEP
ncbi:MAG: hypothetical protein Q4F81_12605, partial [Eubacteriales bacterium]|nr:hypothetical protein [Eubacteriales bacterium]